MVHCRDLKTGKPQWTAKAGTLRVVYDDRVICGAAKTITALSAATGKTLWAQKPRLCKSSTAFIIGDSLWLGGFKPFQGRTSGKHGPAWALIISRSIRWPPAPCSARSSPRIRGIIIAATATRPPTAMCWPAGGAPSSSICNRATCCGTVGPAGSASTASCLATVCSTCRRTPAPATSAAKLAGFNVLAPQTKGGSGNARQRKTPLRLEKGPAYASLNLRSPIPNPFPATGPPTAPTPIAAGAPPWPCPRCSRRRWQVKVGGAHLAAHRRRRQGVRGLGRPAMRDRGRRRARASRPGSSPPARVDSPPTLDHARAIFGCCDGWVYSLRKRRRRLGLAAARRAAGPANDGQWAIGIGLARPRQCVAFATAWPTSRPADPPTSTAESTCCEWNRKRAPFSPRLLSTALIRRPAASRRSRHPMRCPGRGAISFPAMAVTCTFATRCSPPQAKPRPKANRTYSRLPTILEDSWAHRSDWIFGTQCSVSGGCCKRDKDVLFARLLVFDARDRLRLWTYSGSLVRPVRRRPLPALCQGQDRRRTAVGKARAGACSRDGPGRQDSVCRQLSARSAGQGRRKLCR